MSGGEGIASKFVLREGCRPQCCVMFAVMAFRARSFAVRERSDALCDKSIQLNDKTFKKRAERFFCFACRNGIK